MAEGSRTGIPAVNPTYPQGAEQRRNAAGDSPLPGMPTGSNLLPAQSFVNRRLNRSAERIGRGLGTAVSTMRCIPDRLTIARSRIHLVGSRTRQKTSAAAFDMMGTAAQRASNWRDSAEAWLLEATERADRKWGQLSEATLNRVGNLRDLAAHEVQQTRARTRQQFQAAGRRLGEWEQKEPMQVLAAVGVVTFVAGAVIRIWRSSRD